MNKSICWLLQFCMEFISACLQRLLIRVGAILRSVYVPHSRRGLAWKRVKNVEASPLKCLLFVMRLFLASLYSWMEEWKEKQKHKLAESRFAESLARHAFLLFTITLNTSLAAPMQDSSLLKHLIPSAPVVS